MLIIKLPNIIIGCQKIFVMPLRPISRLAELRTRAGLTQAELAVFVGVTTNTIQNWEKEDGLTQLGKYLKLAEILGLENLNDLFKYVEETEYKPSRKEFSLEELRRIRQEWGTDVTVNNVPGN